MISKFNIPVIFILLLLNLSFDEVNLLGHDSHSVVTFEEFGAKGDGSDETGILLKAISYAREKKLPLQLNGKTYKLSPQETIDITGIPLFSGKGTIDLSGTGPNAGHKSMTHVFRVKGEKQLLQSDVSVRSGSNQIKLKTGLKINRGDVLFITSFEPLPNRKRPYNCRGQRAVVKDYNTNTGLLSIIDSVFFTISKSCIWKNTKKPDFESGKDINFVTSKMNLLGCFEIIYSKARISGTYTNFALAAISLRSSEGVFENVKVDLPVTANNGYSLGISVADLSAGVIKNCTLSGGRHMVSGTGGGLWNKAESGGNNSAAGYPSVLEINGGTYRGSVNVNGISEDIGTLDSHGNVYRMTIRNCEIFGGINVGAYIAVIDSVTIHTATRRAFNFGSDVDPGSDWGFYTVSNVTIDTEPENKISLMLTKSDVNVLTLTHIMLKGINSASLIADFRYPGPKRLNISNLILARHDLIMEPPRFLLNKGTDLEIDEISCLKKKDIRRF